MSLDIINLEICTYLKSKFIRKNTMDEFEIEYKISTLDELEDLLSDLLDLLRHHSAEEITNEQIDAVFRIVHSVKGNSKACDFEELSSISHEFEDLLLKVKQGDFNFSREILDLSLDYCDEASSAIERTRKDLSFIPNFDSLRKRLEEYDPNNAQKEKLETPKEPKSNNLYIDQELTVIEDSRSAKILLVDDDNDLRSLLTNYIKTYFPASIKDANNGNEASKSCMRVQYDVIICDYQMPIMDGQAFIKALRENYSLNQHTPVIFLTALNPSLINDEGMWEDVFLLKKPIKKSKLIYYIRCALEIKNQQNQAS